MLRLQKHQSGSAIIASLFFVTITCTLVAVALSRATNGTRTVHQSSQWSQAGHAAEAGVEAALLAANESTWATNGWSGTPGSVGSAPVTYTTTLSTGVSDVGPIKASVSVDAVNMGGNTWLRIRSTGQADLFSGRAAGYNPLDVKLRKVSIKTNKDTHIAVTNPLVSRTIEVLAAPAVSHPFQSSIVVQQAFTMDSTSETHSYDSSDSTKSHFNESDNFNGRSYGEYGDDRDQRNGHICSTDTATWNVNHAHICGDINIPSGGNVTGSNNCTGATNNGYKFNYPQESAPTWATTTANYTKVPDAGLTLQGCGTNSSPCRYKISNVSCTKTNQCVHLTNPPGVTESWVEVHVPGTCSISNLSNCGIVADKGVHVKLYVEGTCDVHGNTNSGGSCPGIQNCSKLPEMMEIHMCGGSPGAGTKQICNYDGIELDAVHSGPNCATSLNNCEHHGSCLSAQLSLSNHTKFCFDEALKPYAYSTPNSGYSVTSFVEAVR